MIIRTPDLTNVGVKKFCKQINRSANPVLIPISPDPSAQALDCFHVVQQRVEKDGGKLVLGWAIWEWPGVYLEAEHHAVYASPDGGLLYDYTPSQFPTISSRMFLADESATYDFECEGVRRDNHRLALRRDPLIDRLFETASEIGVIMNSIPGVGMVSLPVGDARRVAELEKENVRLSFAIGMKYSSRNEKCFCGSGRKFKHCHGKDV